MISKFKIAFPVANLIVNIVSAEDAVDFVILYEKKAHPKHEGYTMNYDTEALKNPGATIIDQTYPIYCIDPGAKTEKEIRETPDKIESLMKRHGRASSEENCGDTRLCRPGPIIPPRSKDEVIIDPDKIKFI